VPIDINHNEHFFALDVQDNLRHISEVTSGRGGYYCQGCRREMLAKKGNIKIHHFAHDPKETAIKGKCTYSDETFRHKVAKEILQMLKSIKVPPLRKFPPSGVDGLPNLIRESWVVQADTVAIEMPFFENEAGEIKWGKNITSDSDSGRHLVIQPDVTFFDKAGNPILLIELVATHKVDNPKFYKVRNLGLDMVEVSLPTGPTVEIEEAFKKSSRTKWIFNYEQENTEYQFIPIGPGQSLSPGDEFERQLVGAGRTYECKKFELKEAIRRIRKYLESEQYREATSTLASKIRRVEKNTTAARKEWAGVQERIEREVEIEFAAERERLDQREAENIELYTEFRRDQRDVERKYEADKARIEREKEEYRSPRFTELQALRDRYSELGGGGETLQDRISSLADEEREVEIAVESEKAALDEEERRIDQETADIVAEIERAVFRAKALPGEHHGDEIRVRTETEANEIRIRSELEKLEIDLRAGFERLRKISADAIKARDFGRTPRVNSAIKRIIDAGQLLDAIPIASRYERQLREAKEALDSGAYKNWH